jgi:hypothetical protein
MMVLLTGGIVECAVEIVGFITHYTVLLTTCACVMAM